MSAAAFRHMILHDDALADEFDAILGYRSSHADIVLPAPGGADVRVTSDGDTRVTSAGDRRVRSPG